MLISKECVICHTLHTLDVPEQGYRDWLAGRRHIQDAMPLLPPEDRELLISGVCDPCFERMFGDE